MQSMFGGLSNDNVALFALNAIDSSGSPIAFITMQFLSDHARLDADGGYVEICYLRLSRSRVRSNHNATKGEII